MKTPKTWFLYSDSQAFNVSVSCELGYEKCDVAYVMLGIGNN